ncbi:MAG: dephospho-CoA kinase [Paracoccaceae bacterium]|nr:dephospho-CoA kinase [Paracoccaceae bacterium]
MIFKLGLTGSIGMGKSTTAQMFADLGCAVWDADAAVHRLYAAGGKATEEIAKRYPDVVDENGVSRDKLRERISQAPEVLKAVEAIVHPLVRQDRKDFALEHPDKIGVFDIPLLFETGGETEMDATLCVTVPPELQEKRVLERGTMTPAQFQQIRDRQMPNAEKCARSDYVIETDTLEHARAQVQAVLADIKSRIENA